MRVKVGWAAPWAREKLSTGSDSPNRADRWALKSIICTGLSEPRMELLGVPKPTMNRFAATVAGPTLRRTCAGSGVPRRSARDAGPAMELSNADHTGGDENRPPGAYR